MSTPPEDPTDPALESESPASAPGLVDPRDQPPPARLERARARTRRALFGGTPSSDPDIASTTGNAVIDAAPSSPAEGVPAAVARGSALGRYLVLGPLGRGGMGTIFKAYDEALDRVVAVKQLHSETTQRHAQRLRREAQALARLSHPNVVHVYEVGQAHGQWFIAMEFVLGQTLRQWQTGEHDWRERVRVYLQAGEGLHAAHAAGLVHRDFKPENCIIDTQDRVRVLDFGLVRDAVRPSREQSEEQPEEQSEEQPDEQPPDESERLRPSAHDDSPMTRTGTVLGTVAYMPPEQFDGRRADARSDQFSFCVSLYEAVYGERPFEGTTMTALMRAVRDGRIRPPPRGHSVPVSLRSILLRGLRDEPDARWPSMNALLSALRERVAPPRRRFVVVGLTVGLMTVGGGVALGQYAQVKDRCSGARAQLEGVWDDARRRDLETAIGGMNQRFTPDAWVRIEQQLDDYARRWTETHEAACTATRVTQDQTEADMGRRMRCLHERKVALRATVDVLVDPEPTVLEHAWELTAGLPSLDRCDDLEALMAVVPLPDDPDVTRRVDELREQLATLAAAHKAGKTPPAEEIDPIVEQAEDLEYGPLVAEAKALRGQLREAGGRFDDAEHDLHDAYRQAVEHRHEDVALSAAQTLTWVVGLRLARHAEGKVWGRVALAHVTRARGDEAPKREAGVARYIGSVLSDQGDLDQALVYQQRALATLEHASSAHAPDRFAREIATVLDNIGISLARQGKLDEALTYEQRALALLEPALGEHHPNLANVLNNLGAIERISGALDQALIHGRRSLQIFEDARGPHHPDVATALDSVGSVLARQGKLDQALEHYHRSLTIRRETLGEDHPAVANILHNIGTTVSTQGKWDEALTYYRQALAIRQRTLGAEHADIASDHYNIGMVLMDQGHLDEALTHQRTALAIYEKTLGEEHPDLGGTLNNIGEILALQGRLDAALTHFRRALAIKEKVLGPHPRVAASLADIGHVLHVQGKRDEARDHYERALTIWEEALGERYPEVTIPRLGLARIALDERDFSTARTHAESVISILESSESTPVSLAEAHFVLARSLAPDRGARARARALAEQARDEYRAQEPPPEESLAEVERWLTAHPSRVR